MEYFSEYDDEDLELPDDDEPVNRSSNAGKNSALEQGRTIPANFKPTLKNPLPVIRCTAKVRNGPRTGERCGRWSIAGHEVCLSHGGNLQNVKEAANKRIEAARLRLIDNADAAIDTLIDLMENSSADGIKLGAAKEVLDRAGIKGPVDFHVEVEHKMSPADSIRNRLASIAKRLDAGPIDLGEVIPGEATETPTTTTNDEEPSE